MGVLWTECRAALLNAVTTLSTLWWSRELLRFFVRSSLNCELPCCISIAVDIISVFCEHSCWLNYFKIKSHKSFSYAVFSIFVLTYRRSDWYVEGDSELATVPATGIAVVHLTDKKKRLAMNSVYPSQVQVFLPRLFETFLFFSTTE